MKHIDEKDRDQIQMLSLDMMVDQHSTVRVLDLFVQWALDHDLGFKREKQLTGRPSFPLRTLLGIYIYGYLNKLRSSRDLEKLAQSTSSLCGSSKDISLATKPLLTLEKIIAKRFETFLNSTGNFVSNLISTVRKLSQ